MRQKAWQAVEFFQERMASYAENDGTTWLITSSTGNAEDEAEHEPPGGAPRRFSRRRRSLLLIAVHCQFSAI